ncbi:hypothetical protein CR513_51357, partial [Mucuna pruriens]
MAGPSSKRKSPIPVSTSFKSSQFSSSSFTSVESVPLVAMPESMVPIQAHPHVEEHYKEWVSKDACSCLQRLGISLPFDFFFIDVLRTLGIAPSQLHPNSLAILQAFKIVCRALSVVPTTPFLFNFYTT